MRPLRECKCGTVAYTEQELHLFHKSPRNKYGRAKECKECMNKAGRNRAANKSEEDKREKHLQYYYDIGNAEYNYMYTTQKGRCKICGDNKPGDGGKYFHVDHCHTTLRVRGLLCVKCNKGLGCFSDREDLLLEAIEYLKKG